ncbi:NAD(P)-dependent oxidoreductase [Frateuria aurantia]
MDIGLIGLGAMGQAIAGNLIAAGHQLKVWTRSGRGLPGAVSVNDPAEIFQSEVVLTLLSDDTAIREVLLERGLLAAARTGTVHAVISTISVEMSKTLEHTHRVAGINYVAAPVLGRPDVAARGELNILAAGSAAALQVMQPIFEVIGKRVWRMGAAPAAAHASKIACNMMITMAIEAMAEAVTLTEPHGVQREDFFELILNTLFGSRSYQVYSTQMLQGTYQPGFKASLGLKDLRLAREVASALGRSLPMLDAVHAQMAGAVAAGGAERDWSIMAEYTLRDGDLSSPLR